MAGTERVVEGRRGRRQKSSLVREATLAIAFILVVSGVAASYNQIHLYRKRLKRPRCVINDGSPEGYIRF